MIVRNATNCAEAAEVVFIGIVGAMPGYDVKGSVCLGGGKEVAVEFR